MFFKKKKFWKNVKNKKLKVKWSLKVNKRSFKLRKIRSQNRIKRTIRKPWQRFKRFRKFKKLVTLNRWKLKQVNKPRLLKTRRVQFKVSNVKKKIFYNTVLRKKKLNYSLYLFLKKIPQNIFKYNLSLSHFNFIQILVKKTVNIVNFCGWIRARKIFKKYKKICNKVSFKIVKKQPLSISKIIYKHLKSGSHERNVTLRKCFIGASFHSIKLRKINPFYQIVQSSSQYLLQPFNKQFNTLSPVYFLHLNLSTVSDATNFWYTYKSSLLYECNYSNKISTNFSTDYNTLPTQITRTLDNKTYINSNCFLFDKNFSAISVQKNTETKKLYLLESVYSAEQIYPQLAATWMQDLFFARKKALASSKARPVLTELPTSRLIMDTMAYSNVYVGNTYQKRSKPVNYMYGADNKNFFFKKSYYLFYHFWQKNIHTPIFFKNSVFVTQHKTQLTKSNSLVQFISQTPRHLSFIWSTTSLLKTLNRRVRNRKISKTKSIKLKKTLLNKTILENFTKEKKISKLNYTSTLCFSRIFSKKHKFLKYLSKKLLSNRRKSKRNLLGLNKKKLLRKQLTRGQYKKWKRLLKSLKRKKQTRSIRRKRHKIFVKTKIKSKNNFLNLKFLWKFAVPRYKRRFMFWKKKRQSKFRRNVFKFNKNISKINKKKNRKISRRLTRYVISFFLQKRLKRKFKKVIKKRKKLLRWRIPRTSRNFFRKLNFTSKKRRIYLKQNYFTNITNMNFKSLLKQRFFKKANNPSVNYAEDSVVNSIVHNNNVSPRTWNLFATTTPILRYNNQQVLIYFFKNPIFLKLELLTKNQPLFVLSNIIRELSHVSFLQDYKLSNNKNLVLPHYTNLVPHQSFSHIIPKKVHSIFATERLRADVVPWFYHTLIRFIENCSGRKVLFQFYPFLDQEMNKDFAIRYKRWIPRMASYERMLGHKFFLEEALYIIHLSLTLRDPVLFASWLKAIILRISFWKTRSIFRFLKYLFNTHFLYLFNELGVKGLKLKLKGKISAGGNSRKRSILYRVGKTSHSTVNLRVVHESKTINTFTGVMGFQVWLFY
jgi:hypothetical protein